MMSMTNDEARRVRIIGAASSGLVTNGEASEQLGISIRQIIRLKTSFARNGARGMVHGNAGRKPRHALSDEVKTRIVELFEGKYFDYNFSHFTERLNEAEGMSVSRSSVFRVLKGAGIKSKKAVKHKAKQHRPRPRKTTAGIMWQTDASRHKWFGEEHGYATLHAYIDDATGVVTGAFFTETECMRGYAAALEQGVLAYGLPLSIYSDRHTIFRSPKELTDDEILSGTELPLSNFGKALYELGIKQITAHSPQAKGRIERLWNTFQDRLVAELRFSSITNIADANKMIAEGFISDYNRRFAVLPHEDGSACMPFDRSIDLGLVFSIRDTRRVGGGNTISYKGEIYTPEDEKSPVFVRGRILEVRETFDGAVYVIQNGMPVLMKKVFRAQKAIDVGVKKKAGVVSPHKPALDHPWRGGFKINPAIYNNTQTGRRG